MQAKLHVLEQAGPPTSFLSFFARNDVQNLRVPEMRSEIHIPSGLRAKRPLRFFRFNQSEMNKKKLLIKLPNINDDEDTSSRPRISARTETYKPVPIAAQSKA